MKQNLLLKLFFIFTMLIATSLCLLGLPFDRVNADPPDPTPSLAMGIRTKLQPYQMFGIQPSQSDGRLLTVAPLPAGANGPLPEPTPGPGLDIITKLQSYQSPAVEPSRTDGRLFKEAPLPSEVEGSPIGTLAQQTLYAVADATVLQGYPSDNFGDTTDMWAGYDEYLEPDGKIARSLVKFNMSLPPNQAITKATLRVYLVSSWDYPNISRTIMTYRVTANWAERGVTWSNQPGYGNAYGSRSIIHEGWGWYEFDVTSLVRNWYNGTYSNYGIILRGPEVSGLDASWRSFSTREGSYGPQLVVEYSPTQDYLIYLPLSMKNYLPPTSTPTPTPSPCPQIGAWSGTTNQGYPLSFTVSNTPSCQVRSLTITVRVWCSSGLPRTITVSWNTLPISDNHFSTGSGFEEVVGDFISSSTATGTWKYFDFSCSGSGTWTASH